MRKTSLGIQVLRILILVPMLCFTSCAVPGLMPLDLPARPAQPQVKWIHLTPETVKVVNPVLLDLGLDPMEPGELLNYENFQTMAAWIIEERGYVHQLENLLAAAKEPQP